MGAWGIDVFDNDEASDWLHELGTSGDIGLLSESLASAAAPYLEAPEAERLLCAAAAIAASLEKTAGGEPEKLMEWAVASNKDEVRALVPEAIAGVSRVLADESELRELWQENEEEYPAWESQLKGLIERLRAA